MNIIYLKYAITVSEYGSISKAAEKLFVAQPNVSRSIKELEKELNITIFDRTTKGMSLTPDGEKLIQYGKKIMKEIDNLENIFKENSPNKLTFSISVPRATYISDAFAEFTKKLPSNSYYEIYYKETNALRAINNILHSEYKMGIIRYAYQYDKYFKEMLEEKNMNYELVTEFNYVLIMSKDSDLSKLDNIRFDNLKDYIEIAHADPYVPSLSLGEVRKQELPDNINKRIFVFERASQFDILSSNTKTFMWVSPIPQGTLEKYNLIQKKCPDNIKRYKDVLIYPKSYHLSQLDKDFISELCISKRKNLENI